MKSAISRFLCVFVISVVLASATSLLGQSKAANEYEVKAAFLYNFAKFVQWPASAFSDPGLQLCREATRRPVFGINECGVLTALTRGDRFGIIAIAAQSIARHQRYLRQMGLTDRLAGERPLGMTVAETASGDGTFARMEAVGRELVEKDGAGVIVMGCAGMARHRRPLEAALGVPVIDPTQAAVAMAIGAVQAARM